MTSSKILGIILGVAIIISAFFSVFGKDAISRLFVDDEMQESIVVPKKQPSETQAKTQNPPSSTILSFSMTDIKSHNSATTCYSAINGKVYDLTDWVDSHPGGRATILMICGKDGSALFNAQHGRSNKIANILSKYYIGNLN